VVTGLPLRQGDGEETREHPIGAFYFDAFDAESNAGSWLTSRLSGPLVDLGAGAGRHALRFQGRFETVAVETSPALVEAMRDRGVVDVREGDMFALRDAFERDRFASALAIGTQIGLAGSMRGLSAFLGDLAFVTTPGATAVIDSYDPDHPGAADLLGYARTRRRGSRIASCGSRTTGDGPDAPFQVVRPRPAPRSGDRDGMGGRGGGPRGDRRRAPLPGRARKR